MLESWVRTKSQIVWNNKSATLKSFAKSKLLMLFSLSITNCLFFFNCVAFTTSLV